MVDKINILLYIDPFWQVDNQVINYHLGTLLTQNLPKHKFNIKALFSEIYTINKEVFDFADYTEFFTITIDEIRNIFPVTMSYQDIWKKEYSENGFSNSENQYFANLCRAKLNGFKPDIICCIGYYSDFLKFAFPDSLILSQENAIFSSRAPFMRTLFYDPCGFGRFSFLHKFQNEIKNIQLTKEENDTIEYLKASIVKLIDENNPIKEIFEKEFKNKFKNFILLPLCNISGYDDEETKFQTEFDYTEFVMKNIPDDTAVIVTQHDIGAVSLTSDMISYFKKKYKNFIYMKDVHSFFGSASLNFYQYCNTILNCFSTTGFQTLLWDNNVIAMDKYSRWYASGIGIKDLFVQKSSFINNILYWYLTHYCIFEKRIFDGNWMYNYLVDKLEKFRKDGITFDYYNKIEDIDELSEYIIDYVKNYYNSKKMNHSDFKLKPLERFFSIKNHNNHKVITVAGVKTKIKRKKV